MKLVDQIKLIRAAALGADTNAGLFEAAREHLKPAVVVALCDAWLNQNGDIEQ